MLVPIILSGGDGTRLWPASRKSFPKQFVKLVDEKKSLFQAAVERINSLKIEHSGLVVVSGENHRFLLAEQLSETNINLNKVILEPIARNTAPAIALAAIDALKKYPTAKLLIQTADHIIPDLKYFNQQIIKAIKANFPIITFGVKPTRPETGFGYIKLGNKIENSCLFKVNEFIEKPNYEKAQVLIKEKHYLWNSGMFFIDAKTYLDELEKFEPKILSSCREALEKSVIDLGFLKVNKQAFIKAPNKSIDYAVIERSKKVAVLPYEQQWRDLGSWDSVFEYLPADKNGNYLTGDVISSNTINTMIRSESRLVATSGVKDLLIVDTPDVILITKKNSAQEIKTLVQDLKKKNRIEATDNAKVHRPWGSYQSLCKGNNFQVKIIEVNPKKSLSLQLHNHRAEHWVVVNGTAEVINGDQKFILNENQSTFIPLGVKHRLTNPRNEKLKIIEVQSGTYLGEDDIIRFEDAHNRI